MKKRKEQVYIFTASELVKFIQRFLSFNIEETKKIVKVEMDELIKEIAVLNKSTSKPINTDDLNKRLEEINKEMIGFEKIIEENQKQIDKFTNEIHSKGT